MKRRILFVDDEAAILFAMSDYFESLGFEADTARSVEEAERLVSSKAYDLVFVDLRLGTWGGRQGLEVIETVRRLRTELPIALLTAYGSPELVEDARARGATMVLQKPRPLPELAQIAMSLMGTPAASEP